MEKQKRPQTTWMKHLMATWEDMKKKDKDARFPDAMKAAKKTYKKESS